MNIKRYQTGYRKSMRWNQQNCNVYVKILVEIHVRARTHTHTDMSNRVVTIYLVNFQYQLEVLITFNALLWQFATLF